MSEMMMIPCKLCGTPTPTDPARQRKLQMARRGIVYCCPEHKREAFSKMASETMARTNREYASARMTERNPMQRPEVRAKQRTTLRAMGWKPPVQGGNGKGPTAPQLLLASALGWPMEIAIPARKGSRERGMASCYKIDIGNPTLQIGIEVDGGSHRALDRKAQDRKKEAFLNGVGWTVLRFSNRAVTEHLEECVKTVLSTISALKKPTPT
jgi:hypothetical protein